ncbi:MAG: hypothetical protein ACR2PQ_12300 [Myxococcota bacterium]
MEPLLGELRGMGVDTDAFLERFRAFGRTPSAATYLPLFDSDATLFDSGMAEPIRVPEITGHIEAILRLVPDFQMVPERWRESAGTVFIEASNSATLAGESVRWDSVYCVDLRGDRVVRGRRYYDRRPLFARLDPQLPSLPPEVQGNGAPEEVARGLSAVLSGAEREIVGRAGDETLSFTEWHLVGTVGRERFEVRGIDRTGADGARSYFDTLVLAARLAEEAA